MKKETTPAVDAIASLHIEGNVIPQQWFQRIRLNGRPDTIAVIILGEVFYWYRPTIVRDEATGEVKELRRKFDADKWQCSYQSLADRFGFTKRQAQDAAKRLRDAGLITLELRNFKSKSGTWLSNVLFIEPIPDAIRAITFEDTPSYATTEEVLRQNVTPPTPERMTYTETPTETPTEIPTERESGAKDAPPAEPLAETDDAISCSESTTRREEEQNASPVPTEKENLYSISTAVADVCKMDLRANQGMIFRASKQLSRASPPPTPELIGATYGRGGPWYHRDWRGKKGEPPTPDAIPKTWAQLVPRAPAARVSLTREDFTDAQWNRMLPANQQKVLDGCLYDA